MTDVLSGLAALLSDPSYAIPLVLALVAAVGLGGWGWMRRSSPDVSVWRPTRGRAGLRPEAAAAVGLREGRYLPTIDLLGRRLGAALSERYHVRIDRPAELRALRYRSPLPPGMTVAGVVHALVRAYRSAYVAEFAPRDATGPSWFQRRREARAGRDFARAVGALTITLKLLEAP